MRAGLSGVGFGAAARFAVGVLAGEAAARLAVGVLAAGAGARAVLAEGWVRLGGTELAAGGS